ncbi:MAG TPA: pyrroline-5-carboxylate reductase [Chthonomonadales bacterium]|nr:pyrroline-5-carboxylate reductase [Chthonomonadales bacterium]
MSRSLDGKRVGIIGAGAMGSALARGLLHSGATVPENLLISDRHAAHLQQMSAALGIDCTQSNRSVADRSDIVVLAVKPQTVHEVAVEIAPALDAHQLLISIAAGVRIATIETALPRQVPVVRAMPNTAAQVNSAACAFSPGTHATDEHLAWAREIFESVGAAVQVDETMMDAVTALSGSGPAYVYLMIEALVDGGVKVGLPRELAHRLASQTVLGAARMVIETGMHPAQLKDMVATPAGTTITALAALEQSGLRAALIDAVERAARRSSELGQ